ncbi:unnamed protein product [Rangifer tarandus platyrhynchus]|uniref:ubiquitinyl hydrolase 1 n=1 Tax=Rangifer tarandus platyrhynchus TaxID=3082113 RepID=A0ABN8XIZ5_RANTA|nr:unnamed protein product [Rangifer tarandus platyrhynchus]
MRMCLRISAASLQMHGSEEDHYFIRLAVVDAMVRHGHDPQGDAPVNVTNTDGNRPAPPVGTRSSKIDLFLDCTCAYGCVTEPAAVSDNKELQALSMLYNCPIEIYDEELRLSYTISDECSTYLSTAKQHLGDSTAQITTAAAEGNGPGAFVVGPEEEEQEAAVNVAPTALRLMFRASIGHYSSLQPLHSPVPVSREDNIKLLEQQGLERLITLQQTQQQHEGQQQHQQGLFCFCSSASSSSRVCTCDRSCGAAAATPSERVKQRPAHLDARRMAEEIIARRWQEHLRVTASHAGDDWSVPRRCARSRIGKYTKEDSSETESRNTLLALCRGYDLESLDFDTETCVPPQVSRRTTPVAARPDTRVGMTRRERERPNHPRARSPKQQQQRQKADKRRTRPPAHINGGLMNQRQVQQRQLESPVAEAAALVEKEVGHSEKGKGRAASTSSAEGAEHISSPPADNSAAEGIPDSTVACAETSTARPPRCKELVERPLYKDGNSFYRATCDQTTPVAARPDTYVGMTPDHPRARLPKQQQQRQKADKRQSPRCRQPAHVNGDLMNQQQVQQRQLESPLAEAAALVEKEVGHSEKGRGLAASRSFAEGVEYIFSRPADNCAAETIPNSTLACAEASIARPQRCQQLVERPVYEDGNCLYRAACDQMYSSEIHHYLIRLAVVKAMVGHGHDPQDDAPVNVTSTCRSPQFRDRALP